ncbi:hypothetical protein Tco_0897330 [Tanacetum coccineum]
MCGHNWRSGALLSLLVYSLDKDIMLEQSIDYTQQWTSISSITGPISATTAFFALSPYEDSSLSSCSLTYPDYETSSILKVDALHQRMSEMLV